MARLGGGLVTGRCGVGHTQVNFCSDTPRRVPGCKNSLSAVSVQNGSGLVTEMVQNPSRGDHGYASAEHEAAEGSSVSPGTEDDIKVLAPC